ncbi:hypothetical protein K439DRAFT_591673 [Ramaria rubella]|nr:hypothetical protein K439DRAFT_591673 [Ramaria rubella]
MELREIIAAWVPSLAKEIREEVEAETKIWTTKPADPAQALKDECEPVGMDDRYYDQEKSTKGLKARRDRLGLGVERHTKASSRNSTCIAELNSRQTKASSINNASSDDLSSDRGSSDDSSNCDEAPHHDIPSDRSWAFHRPPRTSSSAKSSLHLTTDHPHFLHSPCRPRPGDSRLNPPDSASSPPRPQPQFQSPRKPSRRVFPQRGPRHKPLISTAFHKTKLYPCTYPGCGEPFMRESDRVRHVKGKHARREVMDIAAGRMRRQDAVALKEFPEVGRQRHWEKLRCPGCEMEFCRRDAVIRHCREKCKVPLP